MKKPSFRNYLNEKNRAPGFRKGFERERKNLRLGRRIFLIRQKAGLTQAELARRIGTRQSNISRLEQGDYNFTIGMLEKIAKALGSDLKIELTPMQIDKAA